MIRSLLRNLRRNQAATAEAVKGALTVRISGGLAFISTGKCAGCSEPSVEILKKLMDALEVSADYLISEEEESLEVKIKDKNLAERVKLMDSLDDGTREALIIIIDGLLTNQKMKELMSSQKDARIAG